ncbi:hypothetical protein Q8A73_007238 [Channa argus]|nr:hypothetical protein Q8A73_007238 [Channa argus]
MAASGQLHQSVKSLEHVYKSGVSTDRDRNRLNKLSERAGSVLGCPLDSIRKALSDNSTACDPERPTFHIPASLRSFPTLKELPICRTSATTLTLSLDIDHLIGPPRTPLAPNFPSVSAQSQGTQGRAGTLLWEPPGRQNPPIITYGGGTKRKKGLGGPLQGAAIPLLFLRRGGS